MFFINIPPKMNWNVWNQTITIITAEKKSKNAVYDYSGRQLYNSMSFTINEKRYSVTLFPTLNKKDNVFIGFSSKLRSSTAF